MEIFSSPDLLCYDGTQIRSLWAYERFGVRGDSVVIFRGPMRIPAESMLDLEDIREGSAISGDDLIHFIVERFDSPPNMHLAYCMQRLIAVWTKDELLVEGVKAVRRGDDLFVDDRKLTVSVATCGVSSEKIHFGINVINSGVPPGVRAIGLNDLGITDPVGFAERVVSGFSGEIEGIESAVVKTKGIL